MFLITSDNPIILSRADLTAGLILIYNFDLIIAPELYELVRQFRIQTQSGSGIDLP